jgi:hypothetical protein
LLSLCLLRSSFGGRAMPAQQILKAMAGMFESKDAKARALVKEIVVRALHKAAVATCALTAAAAATLAASTCQV